jgi:uncharacterized membrane protein
VALNYNPYAAPQVPPPPQASDGAGQPRPWTASEALSLAWARFQEHALVIILTYLVGMILTYLVAAGVALLAGQVPTALVATPAVRAPTPASFAALALGNVVSQAVSAFLQVGFARIWLDAARGIRPTFETLFSGADRMLPMLGLNIVFGLGVVIGCALLIVPGVLLLLVYPLAPFYVVDAKLGPIDAMRRSWSDTAGQKGELAVLALAGVGLGILGVMMCCVGLLATTPLFMVAAAVAFTWASGRGVAAASPPAPLPPWTT